MKESKESEDGLIGCGSSPRVMAVIIDNLAALMFAVSGPSAMPESAVPLGIAVGVLSYFAYFFVLEGAFGRTLGKFGLGLVVLHRDGSRAGWRAATFRTLTRAFEVNPFLLGALPGALLVAFSERHQRLGDMWAGTVVVRVK